MMKKQDGEQRAGAGEVASVTLVAGWAATMPALLSAMMARNNPMPAAMALRSECGMPLISQTRMPEKVRNRKITPEMNTAPSACSRCSPWS